MFGSEHPRARCRTAERHAGEERSPEDEVEEDREGEGERKEV